MPRPKSPTLWDLAKTWKQARDAAAQAEARLRDAEQAFSAALLKAGMVDTNHPEANRLLAYTILVAGNQPPKRKHRRETEPQMPESLIPSAGEENEDVP